MGKKFFKFRKFEGEEADRPGPAAPDGEQAQHSSGGMRDLLTREYAEHDVSNLKYLDFSGESAMRYDDVEDEVDPAQSIQEVIAPSSAEMLKIVSEQTGLRVVNLEQMPRAAYDLRGLLTPEQAKSMRAVPVERKEDNTVVIAIADPSNPMIADELRLLLDCDVETVIARESEIDERIEQYYGMGSETIDDIVRKESEEETEEDVLQNNSGEVDLSDMEALAGADPVVKLVNVLLLRAISDRASDIHIEPFPNFIRIRYRVDGVLREIPSPPRSQLVAITSRVKVMASMNISESRLPQDGRIKLLLEGREVDMRCSSVPTVHGESVVMRVLDKSMMMIGISQIGMQEEVVDSFMNYARRPNGIVLVTGPTGSGKTTSLYAALSEIRDPGEKFITTEDPVEYELAGIQQVNINEKVGLTFARCLRAILRQDPDKVLVGEIRDVETAQIAVQAALTGHLVLSTLHTNSAAATITRLLDMGVEPFLITSALQAVIGQRLVRTICQSCKTPYHPSDDDLMAFGVTRKDLDEQGVTLYHGEGCAECAHTGYRGRMGIFELLEVSDEMRDLILDRGTTDEVQELAVRQGMITMREDGWIKVCLGVTTLAEVNRQTPRDASTEPARTFGDTDGEEEMEPVKELPREQPKLEQPKPELNEKTMQVNAEAAARLMPQGDSKRAGGETKPA